MTKGPSLFKKRDATRAIEAGFDAGADEVRVEIGSMVVTAKKNPNGGPVADVEDDDKELAAFRRRKGYA